MQYIDDVIALILKTKATALYPYNPALANMVNETVIKWLAHPAADGWKQDRRLNLWGKRTCVPDGQGGWMIYGKSYKLVHESLSFSTAASVLRVEDI